MVRRARRREFLWRLFELPDGSSRCAAGSEEVSDQWLARFDSPFFESERYQAIAPVYIGKIA